MALQIDEPHPHMTSEFNLRVIMKVYGILNINGFYLGAIQKSLYINPETGELSFYKLNNLNGNNTYIIL